MVEQLLGGPGFAAALLLTVALHRAWRRAEESKYISLICLSVLQNIISPILLLLLLLLLVQ